MALLIPSDVLFDLPDSSFLLETDKTMIPLLTLVELLNSFFKHPRKGQSGNLENYFPKKLSGEYPRETQSSAAIVGGMIWPESVSWLLASTSSFSISVLEYTGNRA